MHDATQASGIGFVYHSGQGEGLEMPRIVGGGVGLFDADGDGDLDAYLVDGNPYLPESRAGGPWRNQLFVNDGGGRFTDATESSGLGDQGYGMGMAIGDVNNDGLSDVYVTNFGPDRLYVNLGGGRFEDVSAQALAGIPEVEGWSSSAAFVDQDGDGWLDIYVVRYVDFDPSIECSGDSGQRDFCGPAAFSPVHDLLLRNLGDGRFEDRSESSGIARLDGPGLGVAIADFDDDGRPDIYVANDGAANHLWLNGGDGSFRESALAMGAALNMHGAAEAGMGVVAADLDTDAWLDLFMTHLADETNTLYRNLGQGRGFQDATGQSGMGAESSPWTGFGTAALDIELDGDLDLAVVNGRVKLRDALPGSGLPEPWNRLAEPNQVFLNDGGARFSPLAEPDCGFCQPIEVSRGLATGDVDGDGDLDLLVGNVESPARLYLNQAPRQGAWLMVDAVDPQVGRTAIGTEVRLAAGGRQQLRVITAAQSYLSSSAPVAHFGLGAATSVDAIELRWPDGAVETFEVDCVDCRVRLEKGMGRQAPEP